MAKLVAFNKITTSGAKVPICVNPDAVTVLEGNLDDEDTIIRGLAPDGYGTRVVGQLAEVARRLNGDAEEG